MPPFSLLCLLISDADWLITATDPRITVTEWLVAGTELERQRYNQELSSSC